MTFLFRRDFHGNLPRPQIADGLLACAVALVTAFVYLSHYGAANALSSDNAFPYVIFADVLLRKLPIDGVMWPESPFFFPDGPMTFLAYLATPDVRSAALLFAILQSTLIFLCLRWLILNSIEDQRRGRTIWIAWMTLFLAMSITGCVNSATWLGQFGSYLFVPNNHGGCLLGVIVAFALLVSPSVRAGAGRMVLLATWCGLLAWSDRLFEIQFMLPGILIGLGIYFVRRRKWYLAASGMLAVLTLSFEALRHFFPSNLSRHYLGVLKELGKSSLLGGDPYSRVDAVVAAQRTLADFHTLFANDPAITFLMLAGMLALVWILLSSSDNDVPRTTRWLLPFKNDRLLASIAVIAALTPLAAGVILGRHIEISSFRYCMTVMLVPLGIAIVISRAHSGPESFRIGAKPMYAFAVMLLIGMAALLDTSRTALATYNLDQEKCFSAAVAARGLKFGVGGYWQGVSMLARQPSGPVTAPIDKSDAGPRLTMMANLGWFGMTATSASGLPVLDFVDEYGTKPEQLDAGYGPFVDRIACPASGYRVYRDSDGVLSRMYRHYEWLPNLVLTRVGSITIPAAAWPADPRFIEGDALHVTGNFNRATPVLQTMQEFPPGQIRKIWIEYTLKTSDPGASVSWSVVPLNAQGRPYAAIGYGELARTGDARQVEWKMENSRPTGVDGLGIAVQAQGDVDLKILALHIALDRSS